jgi:para-nitrobenzyl esterase
MGTSKGQVVKLVHPQLGEIRGLVPCDGVHQFRSLPYATIPHRFADPVLADSLGAESVFDATKFGTIAPQPDDAEYQEFVTPKEHIPHEPLEMDEFRCANLNVSIPTGERKSKDGLPVMVWFHGGSFMLGAASWPQYGLKSINLINPQTLRNLSSYLRTAACPSSASA